MTKDVIISELNKDSQIIILTNPFLNCLFLQGHRNSLES